MRPLDLRQRSSDEYEPLPLSPVVAEAARRARAAIDRLARGRAVSRRDLLQSAAASAAVLSALSSCTSEERASRGASAPGGTFTVPTSIDTTTVVDEHDDRPGGGVERARSRRPRRRRAAPLPRPGAEHRRLRRRVPAGILWARHQGVLRRGRVPRPHLRPEHDPRRGPLGPSLRRRATRRSQST